MAAVEKWAANENGGRLRQVNEAGGLSFKMVRVPPERQRWTILAGVIAPEFAL